MYKNKIKTKTPVLLNNGSYILLLTIILLPKSLTIFLPLHTHCHPSVQASSFCSRTRACHFLCLNILQWLLVAYSRKSRLLVQAARPWSGFTHLGPPELKCLRFPKCAGPSSGLCLRCVLCWKCPSTLFSWHHLCKMPAQSPRPL